MKDKRKKSALYEILDSVFRLPPKAERRDLSETFWHKYFLWRKIPANREDSYILYQSQKCSYIYCGIVIALLSLLFLSEKNITFAAIAVQFIHLTVPVAVFVILPFFLVKMHWNFNAAKEDVLELWQEHEKKRGRIMIGFSLLLCGAVFVFYTCYYNMTPETLFHTFGLRWLYAENYYCFLLFALFLTSALIGALQIALFSPVVLRRYFFLYRQELNRKIKK